MTIGQIRRELSDTAKEALEITHRVTYMGKNHNGEPECGSTDITVFCNPSVTVEELAAAVRVAAQRKLQNEGFYEVYLGSMYKQPAALTDRED